MTTDTIHDTRKPHPSPWSATAAWRLAIEQVADRRELSRRLILLCVSLQIALVIALLPTYGAGEGDGLSAMIVVSFAACAVITVVLTLAIGLFDASARRIGLANGLTILRLLTAAPTAVLVVQGRYRTALAVYLLAVLSDVADGVIARRRGEHSYFGTIMDPVADIVTTTAVYGAFLVQHLVPMWVFGILIVRYATLFVGGYLIFRRVGPMRFSATVVGKIVGVAQAAVAILTLVVAAAGVQPDPIAAQGVYAFLGMVFGSVIVSQLVIGIRYVRKEAKTCMISKAA